MLKNKQRIFTGRGTSDSGTDRDSSGNCSSELQQVQEKHTKYGHQSGCG